MSKIKRQFKTNISFDIYNESKDGKCRYTLGRQGENMLVAICLNPTTIANIKTADQTIYNIESFAKNKGYDGFLVLNIVPLKTDNSDTLLTHKLKFSDKLFQDNFSAITNCVNSKLKNYDVVCAWGDNIDKNIGFQQSAERLLWLLCNEKMNGLYHFYDKLTSKGNPKHPSRGLSFNSNLVPYGKKISCKTFRSIDKDGVISLKLSTDKTDLIEGLTNKMILDLENLKSEKRPMQNLAEIKSMLDNLVKLYGVSEEEFQKKIASIKKSENYITFKNGKPEGIIQYDVRK